GCDMVLGVQWLSTLGDIKWNFQELKMEFVHSNKRLTLRGTTKYLMNMSESVACHSKVEPRLQEIIDAYVEVFAVPTKLPPISAQDHRIPLMPGTQPINIRPYRHPLVQKDAFEAMVKEFLDSGVIKHRQSSFASPVVIVPHPNY
ncbi:hypothetical protein Tco_0239680, partial [Tanacetum coccineum]